MSAIDKDKLIKWINNYTAHTDIKKHIILEVIRRGKIDIQETTVTLGDGSVAKVGDIVVYRGKQTAVLVGFSKVRGDCLIEFEGGNTICINKINLRAYNEQDTWERLEADIDRMVNDRNRLDSISKEVIARAKALADVK